jgi:hypothetical protein
MAATKLIAMHQNKGRSVMQCLKDRTDYAMNGDKTEDEKYISSYQCNPELVDLEFAQAKKEYLHKTWRQPKGDVLAYQIRQSFKPGEITPEEANEVGYETGMRFTKGKHAFIVATHVDRAHIHNHIIFNSTNLDCDRKFRDFWFSGIALQRLSDIICLEHGLSIIPKVKPSERQRRTKYLERTSMRDVIREDILKCLEQKPADFEELLKLLQQEGYEIKRGKHTAICGKEQKRFIRFRSLGEDYTEENLKKIIAGEKDLPAKKEKASDQKVVKSEKRKFDLVVDIQEKMAQGKNGGYVRWAKKYNIKQFAESILFLQQHDIHDKETLDALVDGSSARYHELMKIIKDAEEKMAQNKVLKTHIINYAKTRDTYIVYRKSGYSKKFYEAHRDEIILHKAEKEAFSKLPDGKIPKVKDLNEEFARLLSEKKAAYSEYKKIKKRDAGLSDCEAKCGILLCCTADMESGGRPEKEATAAEINLRAIIKMKLGGCPFFCNSGKAGMYQPSQSEGAAWHRR